MNQQFLLIQNPCIQNLKLLVNSDTRAGVVLVAKTFSLMRASLVGDVVNPTTRSGALSVTMLVGLAAIADLMLIAKDTNIANLSNT